MKYPLTSKQQCQQLVNVLDYLKSQNKKQKKIAEKVGSSTYFFSHLRSGQIQSIPQDLIDSFQENYHINPKYITHGASNMFEAANIMYDNFDEFVDSWDLVEHENNSYLHFFMDENFYNFLINIYTLKINSSESNELQQKANAFDLALGALKNKKLNQGTKTGYLHFSSDLQLKFFVQSIFKQIDFSSAPSSKEIDTAFNTALTTLKENYQPGKNPKEYVLVPIDKYIEITDKNMHRQKSLAELNDTFEWSPVKTKHLKLTHNKKEDGTE
ncbi:hypothetical protein [Coprococcus comes]|uniref:hypothetical protein n=1 Tax=Coprococcus comes TaxID=410072 RepID=UPI00189A2CDC|nr:hypothetical protein [Coprococcus comes]